MLPVQDDFSFGDVMALGGLGLGCAAASACLWYYSRRYVGELSLLPPNRCVARFSVLDFWGNREVGQSGAIALSLLCQTLLSLSPLCCQQLLMYRYIRQPLCEQP